MMLLITLAVLPFGIAWPPTSGPVFVVHTASSKAVTGRVEKLDGGWGMTVLPGGGEPQVEVPAGDLVGFRRTDRPLPPWPGGPGLVLTSGDRIGGTVTGGDGRTVRFVPDYSRREKAADWAVPISSVAAVWVTAPAPRTPVSPADYPWAAGPDRRDVVLLRNGDVVRGTLEALTTGPAGVRVKTGSERLPLPLTRIAAVSLDPALARDRRPKGPYARAVLSDGSRITLVEAKSDGVRLSGKTPYGVAIDVPLVDLVGLDILQGKAVYLSELKPRTASVEAYNGVTWPWTADRSVKGNALRLGDQTFDRGIGTHAKTTLTYDLGGKYRRFEAQVGLDPVTGRRGAVDVRMLVDGKERSTPELTGLTVGGSPRAIVADVVGAKELTLVVDYGPGGDVQDDVNWGDARLIE